MLLLSVACLGGCPSSNGESSAEAIEFSISGQPSFNYVSRKNGQSIRAVTY